MISTNEFIHDHSDSLAQDTSGQVFDPTKQSNPPSVALSGFGMMPLKNDFSFKENINSLYPEFGGQYNFQDEPGRNNNQVTLKLSHSNINLEP